MENLANWYNKKMEVAEFNRLGVGAFILIFHTCIILPATLLALNQNDFNIILIGVITTLSFFMLFTMIAVLPTRIIVPVFLISTITHLVIIGISV